MNIQEMLGNILKGSKYLGTFSLAELLPYAASRHLNGIAVAKEGSREFYLAFLNGEPDGAVYIDEHGSLFGDTAVTQIHGTESYVLCEVQPDIVDALIMGSRIFEKTHLRKSMSYIVPEIGLKSKGIGVITLTIRRENNPQNGIRVSLRKEGKIVGSDITTGKGSVSFKVMYGDYTCIVQERSQSVTTFQVKFDETNPAITLDL
jgi:hypothetical protein